MSLRLHFESNLPYQEEAIAAAVDLFEGQPQAESNFTISASSNNGEGSSDFMEDMGYGNRLLISSDQILKNLRKVQLRNGIRQTETMVDGRYDFDIEMETGTGKTYVYLRTALELSRRYGFNKFVIVVPSLAIKEGVLKTMEITRLHFNRLYNGLPYNYFVYSGDRVADILGYARDNNLNIMLMNIDAFRKDVEEDGSQGKANIINRVLDEKGFGGARPIDVLAGTNPIVIIDEPQSADSTEKSHKAIARLHPLCVFRYSATHREHHDLIYKLDAVDSFRKGLVKQIEVADFVSLENHNEAYFCLKSVSNKKEIKARVEIDWQDKKGAVKRKIVTVRPGDDFYEKSGGRDVYDGYQIDDIYCGEGEEYVSFTNKDTVLRIDKPIGDGEDIEFKRKMIRKTIEEHLDKELEFAKQNMKIKVLSLFFLDRVSNYRSSQKGKNGRYGQIFEEEYNALIAKPKYAHLYCRDDPVESVHEGYFAVDGKGGKKQADDALWKDTNGNTKADDSAYTLIMKDKERLLSFDCPVRFIFSHSALKEGWDNPNVFQICTLNDTKSEIKKRQEIGRGLRLCVDQDGKRIRDPNVNILTVMANESYDKFAEKLQHEYEVDEGIKFGVMEPHIFARIPVADDSGKEHPLGEAKSKQLYEQMEQYGYLDKDGKIQDIMQKALKNDTLVIPPEFLPLKDRILDICKRTAKGFGFVHKNKNRTQARARKQRILSPEFKELWDKIKYKTVYHVNFDSSSLIDHAAQALEDLVVTKPQLMYEKSDVEITDAGVHAEIKKRKKEELLDTDTLPLPDILMYLQNQTNLTRKTLAKILTESGTLSQFTRNPQQYMEEAANRIRQVMNEAIMDGIKYRRIGDTAYYSQELFLNEELKGYLGENMCRATKSVYDYIVYDSEVERSFARSFERDESVKLYVKLPDWFKIMTPLGSYNPDWAAVIDDDGQEKLYFIVETKGTVDKTKRRISENAKIECGEKHFEALHTGIHFKTESDYIDFSNVVNNTPQCYGTEEPEGESSVLPKYVEKPKGSRLTLKDLHTGMKVESQDYGIGIVVAQDMTKHLIKVAYGQTVVEYVVPYAFDNELLVKGD
ncbi:type III restriction-modification system endonuclease [Dialister succinatiphilus]|uniref:type III restriction-modification system endonuclease n=1 Tax=Dialister succinatiphilus TaxID=487173 RepID=UPI0023541B61|nr:DEAD/DEAH box helicase family protein [Dialister succinatiphilus]